MIRAICITKCDGDDDSPAANDCMEWQQLGSKVPRGGNRLTRALGRCVFSTMGWHVEGVFPDQSKLIVAVAPHTSNVDWIVSIAVIWGLGLKASYLVKHSLFRFPLGSIVRALGGIPVDRRSAQGLVGQMIGQFESRSQLVLGVTPEGTRGNVREWKRGFALMAQSTNVPILPAILDYKTRTVRFHPLITDVRDADRTLIAVQMAAASGAPRHAHQD